jgi:hypothetical protein
VSSKNFAASSDVDVVQRLCAVRRAPPPGRDLAAKAGLRREPLDRFGKVSAPFGHHHEIENRAVLASRRIEPRHFLVVDRKNEGVFSSQ